MIDELRPEVRGLVNGRDLGRERPDPTLAERRIALAEEHLESGRANRQARRFGAARSAFYEAIWYSLLALLATWGLKVVAADEEGKHVVLMKFGRNELRDSGPEREAGEALDAYRAMRNQQMYRQPTETELGLLPKHSLRVVEAVRSRLNG